MREVLHQQSRMTVALDVVPHEYIIFRCRECQSVRSHYTMVDRTCWDNYFDGSHLYLHYFVISAHASSGGGCGRGRNCKRWEDVMHM